MYKIVGADGKEYGPVTSDQLRQWITQGRANAETRVLPEGSDQWVTLGSLPEFGLTPSASTTMPPLRTWPAAPTMTSNPPGSIRVFGIINIILGSLGLVCLPFSLIALLMVPEMQRLGGSLMNQWMVISSLFSLVGAVLMLASGIGLCKYKAWARKLAVYYAAFASVMNIVGSFFTFGALQSATNSGPERIGGMVGGIFGTIIGLTYNWLLIYFLTRREVRQALGEIA